MAENAGNRHGDVSVLGPKRRGETIGKVIVANVRVARVPLAASETLDGRFNAMRGIRNGSVSHLAPPTQSGTHHVLSPATQYLRNALCNRRLLSDAQDSHRSRSVGSGDDQITECSLAHQPWPV